MLTFFYMLIRWTDYVHKLMLLIWILTRVLTQAVFPDIFSRGGCLFSTKHINVFSNKTGTVSVPRLWILAATAKVMLISSIMFTCLRARL